jgi:hypothetical protein
MILSTTFIISWLIAAPSFWLPFASDSQQDQLLQAAPAYYEPVLPEGKIYNGQKVYGHGSSKSFYGRWLYIERYLHVDDPANCRTVNYEFNTLGLARIRSSRYQALMHKDKWIKVPKHGCDNLN